MCETPCSATSEAKNLAVYLLAAAHAAEGRTVHIVCASEEAKARWDNIFIDAGIGPFAAA